MTEERYGDMLRKLIAEFTGSVHVYYFDISFAETLRRHDKKPNKHEFNEHDMRRWWVDKDYLGYPNEQLITDAMSESAIDNMIANDIKTT